MPAELYSAAAEAFKGPWWNHRHECRRCEVLWNDPTWVGACWVCDQPHSAAVRLALTFLGLGWKSGGRSVAVIVTY